MKRSTFFQNIIVFVLSTLIFTTSATAASTAWQTQSTNYQAAQSKFEANFVQYPTISGEEKLLKSKELLVSATSLITEYQKLIKIEITESALIKEEEKNSFNSLVDSDISSIQALANSINGAGSFSDLSARQTEITNSWTTAQAHKKYIQGIFLIRKSEQAIEKTNELTAKLKEKVGQLDASNPYLETINQEFESVKNDLEMASQTKDESQTLFNSISKDYSNVNTLYNEGRSKIRKAHIYIKQATSVLAKVNSQVLDQQTSTDKSPTAAPDNTTSAEINLNDFR